MHLIANQIIQFIRNNSLYKRVDIIFHSISNKFFAIKGGFQLRGQLSQPNLCLVITKSQIRGKIM